MNKNDQDYLVRLGAKIKYYRKLRGLTQRDLSAAVGYRDHSMIAQIEKGNTDISRERFIKIADALNVGVDVLLFDDSGNNGVLVESVSVPVLCNITPLASEQSGAVEIPRKLAGTGDFFAITMTGDSMAPYILPGDCLICKKQPFANNGDLVVISVNGEIATIKRYQTERNLIMLYSDNPQYKPFMFTTSDNVNVSIVGRVVEIRRTLK